MVMMTIKHEAYLNGFLIENIIKIVKIMKGPLKHLKQ